MPLVYIPDHTFSAPQPHHYPELQPHMHNHPHYHHSQSSYLNQHQSHPYNSPSVYSSYPVPVADVYPRHQPTYSRSGFSQPYSIQTSPQYNLIEEKKRQLLSDFAASLDQTYPSPPHVDVRGAADSDRIRYLEARLREEERFRARIEQQEKEKRLAELVAERKAWENARAVAAQKKLETHYAQQAQQAARTQIACGPSSCLRQPRPSSRVQFRPETRQLSHQAIQPRPEIAAEQLEAFVDAILSAVNSNVGQERQEGSEEKFIPPVSQFVLHPSATSQPQANSPSRRPTAARSASPSKLPPSTLSRLRLLQSRLDALLSAPLSVATKELQHHLTNLLIEADGLESNGDDLIRKERKAFVVRVETELAKSEGAQQEAKPINKAEEEKKAPEAEAAVQTGTAAPVIQSESPETATTRSSQPNAALSSPTPSTVKDEPEVFVPITSPISSPTLPPRDLPSLDNHSEESTSTSGTVIPSLPAPIPAPNPDSAALPQDAAVDSAASQKEQHSDVSSVASGSEDRPQQSEHVLISSPSSSPKGRKVTIEDWDEESEEGYEVVETA